VKTARVHKWAGGTRSSKDAKACRALEKKSFKIFRFEEPDKGPLQRPLRHEKRISSLISNKTKQNRYLWSDRNEISGEIHISDLTLASRVTDSK